MKSVLPTFYLIGLGIGGVISWCDVHRGSEGDPPLEMKAVLTFAWLFGAIPIYRYCVVLKRVRIGAGELLISNYLREIKVPFDQIIAVTQTLWINIQPVTVQVRGETVFGDRIVFMPQRRFLTWGTHPVVAELRRLAGIE